MQPTNVMLNHSPVQDVELPEFIEGIDVEVDRRGHVTYSIVINSIEDYEIARHLGAISANAEHDWDSGFKATVELLVEKHDYYAHQTLDGTRKLRVSDMNGKYLYMEDVDTHWEWRFNHIDFARDYFGQTLVPWSRFHGKGDQRR